jgi:hypothetical protein
VRFDYQDQDEGFRVENPSEQFLTHEYVTAPLEQVECKLGWPDSKYIYTEWGLRDAFGSSLEYPPYSVPNDAHNVYGLRLESLLYYAWPDTSPCFAPASRNVTFNPFYSWYDQALFFEVERPRFKTERSYYFARPFLDPQPGETPQPDEPHFDPKNLPTKPLVAAFGQPFFLSAWLRQSLDNGYADKFAFSEQYFKRAYYVDAQGSQVDAGILSPYGEFFPTQPGQVTLETMPDDPQVPAQHGSCVVNVIKLQLDVNHDGNMDLSYAGPDNTSQDHPFVFWINNDIDRLHSVDGNDSEQDDLERLDLTLGDYQTGDPSQDGAIPDYVFRTFAQGSPSKPAIPCTRDLEDYARLWIPGVASLPPTFSIRLSLTGSAQLRLFRAAESDGGTGYLFNEVVASDQVSRSPSLYAGLLTSSAPLSFAPAEGEHFIFCGVKAGDATLLLQVLDDAQQVVAETTASLELKDIKQMYERWTVGDQGSIAPSETPVAAVEDLPVGASAFSYADPDSPDIPYILHVHGWNMTRHEKDRFAETAFKRLYWQGYQGRFGSFRWPTLCDFPSPSGQGTDLNNFDESEQQAWKSGQGLRNLLVTLNGKYPGQVRLTAHSMGNVVAGEALRTTTQLVAVYVAMQGAVPAGAYDMAAPFRPIPSSYFDGTTELYRYYPISSPARPYFHQAAGAGAYVDYFNPLDWALNIWLADQNLKPADTLGYSFDISTGTFYQNRGGPTQRILACPTDTYELFAYCVEGQCWPLGAQINVGGVFDQAQQLDLNAAFGFGGMHKGHSGQFRSTNMRRAPFWSALVNTLGVLPP